jgi:hypothetical protein
MKTLKTLILLLLLSIPILARNDSTFTQYFTNNGFSINDSLWTTLYVPDTTFVINSDGDTTSTTIDTSLAVTSKYIPLNFAYDWGFISIEDTGTTYDDSLIVEQGVIGYVGSPSRPIKSDTTWYQIPLKDSTWTIVTAPVVDDNSIHGYLIFTPLMDLIRIKLTNVEAVENRVTYIRGVFKRVVGR